MIKQNPPIYDKEGLFVFYPNNKCGQMSITRKYTGVLYNRCVIKKRSLSVWKDYASKDWSKALTFTIIRNPYERFLSACRYLSQLPKGKEMNIDHTLSCLENVGFNYDAHFIPQWPSLKTVEGKKVDYILRLENIDKDWLLIKDKIKAKRMYPHLNKSIISNSNSFLTVKQKERVYNLYKDDFKLLGYEK